MCTFQLARLLVALVAFATTFLLASDQSVLRAQEIEIPKPVEKALATRDGLQLKATYYPPIDTKIGMVAGMAMVVEIKPAVLRETIPVIMLHQYKGSRKDFEAAASRLQAKGYAVIVPDLRGHGASTTFVGGKKIAAKGLKPADFRAMGYDVRAVKSFLMDENNASRLNIEKLCIVGAEMGASLAANFAVFDWRRLQIPGAKKRGMDVRALVLLSPQISFRGLPMSTFSKPARGLPLATKMQLAKMYREMSVMVVVGKTDAKAYREARRFKDSVKRLFPKPAKKIDQRFYLFVVPTKLKLSMTTNLACSFP